MPDRRVTEDMVTRASEVLWSETDAPRDAGDDAEEVNRSLVRRALEAALLGIGSSVVVTEYANDHGSGWKLWDTAPRMERLYPLEQKIADMQADGCRVRRRTVIVVDDWTEVTGP